MTIPQMTIAIFLQQEQVAHCAELKILKGGALWLEQIGSCHGVYVQS